MGVKDRNLIVLTGGGTAGHVMPHLALLPSFIDRHWQVAYIGSKGIEKKLMREAGVKFYTIQVGKLRRYFSIDNFIDLFRLALGFFQSFLILVRIRPQLIFSKGGFVSVPVAVAGRILGIPVITHESDLTPGLANRIISRFSTQMLYSFPETKRFIQNKRAKLVGSPVRQELMSGDRRVAESLCHFVDSDRDVPVVLVMGGSSGAQKINQLLADALDDLLIDFRVIHLCGRGKMLEFSHPRYASFEFVGPELKDIFALSDVVVSRAGANSIFELLRLKKPMLLIPLEIGSRGDQVDNAKCFEAHGVAKLLRESELDKHLLLASIRELFSQKEEILKSFENPIFPSDSSSLILDVLTDYMPEGLDAKA